MASSLPLHFARLILLRMKKKVTVLPSEHSNMFKEVSVWDPESYVPSPPPSVPVDGCLLASFSKGERKVLDAL